MREIVRFGVKVATSPQGLTAVDFEEIEELGVSRSELTELIAVSAMAVSYNIIADATRVEVDDEFNQILGA